jgi:hypothetical protein
LHRHSRCGHVRLCTRAVKDLYSIVAACVHGFLKYVGLLGTTCGPRRDAINGGATGVLHAVNGTARTCRDEINGVHTGDQ